MKSTIAASKTIMKLLFIMSIVVCCVTKIHAQRDPYLRPFANNSIWNMAIHNNAVYVDAKINAPTAWGVTSDPEIIILSPTAPNVGIFACGWAGSTRCDKGAQITSAPIPDGWINGIPDGTPNNSTAILAQDGHTIINLQCLHRCATSGPASSLLQYPSEDLYGDGIEGGHGGSGMAALGGSIRVGELTPNFTEAQIKANPNIFIKHVIKMNVNTLLYVSKTNGGYRWPAVKADGNYNSPGACDYYGGTVPQFKMGSLLAIPKNVNVETMGLQTGPGLMMARTLQKYGAYLVDATCWDVVAFEVQTGPLGDVENQFATKYGYQFSPQSTSGAWAQDIAKIVQELFVVDNNNAANIGGGPTTDLVNRLAPPICDMGTPGSGIYDCGPVVNVPVTGVSVAPTTASVGTGATTTLTPTVVPSNATNKNVNWASNNTAVATVSATGIVTGVSAGSATITVTTTDGSKTATCAVTVTAAAVNLALNKTGTSSGIEGAGFEAAKAFDGNTNTRWSSTQGVNTAWIYVDLGAVYNISRVVLNWEAAFANGYQVQTSNDASTWTNIFSTTNGNGAIDDLTGLSGNGRYVRMNATTKNTPYDYSLYEFAVYGTAGTAIAVTGVTVTPTTASVVAGATTTLTATVAPANATNKNVTWSSGNTGVATVSTTGVVTGVAAGSATITVTTADGNKTATCAVTVTAATIAVTGVTVSPTTAGIVIGATTTLTATVAPSNASNRNVTWSSGNTSVATVNSVGVVTGVAAGSVTITVTTTDGNKTSTCTVTVTAPGTSAKLTGTIIGTSGSWNNNAAVTKDKVFDGILSTFFDGPVSDGVWVGLDLGSAKTISLAKYCPRASWAARMNGGKIQGSNVADFSSVTDLYTISGSPAENILTNATISNTTAFRYVRYLAPYAGYGNIAELEFWGASGTTVAVTGVTVAPTTASVAVGANTTLTATIAPANATNKNVTWSSGNTAVATVSTAGVVTGVAAGTATVTVTTTDGNKTATCAVTVTLLNVAVTGVTVSPITASVVAGATTALTATVAPANATNKSVTWTSSNTAVATVNSSGVVTGIAVGSATITVTTQDQSKTATCAISVNAISTLKAINSGAGATGSFAADNSFSGGTAFTSSNTIDVSATNAAPAAVYQSERWGNMTYTMTGLTANTSYTVRLHFAEIYFNAAGARIFHVKIAGTQVLTNYDIWVDAGNKQNKAIVKNFIASADGSGNLSIQFISVTDDAKISGIEILSATSVPVTGVSLNNTSASLAINGTQQLTATVTPSNASNKNVTWTSSNTSIATVNTTGLVTGKAVGSATITVTTVDASKTATSAINVTTSSAGPLKIHCIGNSLTQADPGYRGVLKNKLAADGYSYSFVGTKTDGTGSHSGYGGYIVGPGSSSIGNIYDMWTAGPNLNSVACDIIILEIGINDYFNATDANYNPESPAAAKLDGLINLIYSTKPNVTIYVSNLTPVAWDANAFSAWNAQVPVIVNKYVNLGRKCFLADVRNGISWNTSVDISGDQLHPSAAGYTKMGNYYASLLESTSPVSAGNSASARKAPQKVTLVGNEAAASELSNSNVSIYPNPLTTGSLIISTPGVKGSKYLNMFDAAGNKIYTKQLPAGSQYSIDLTGLNYKGVCLVEVSDNKGLVVKKLIVN